MKVSRILTFFGVLGLMTACGQVAGPPAIGAATTVEVTMVPAAGQGPGWTHLLKDQSLAQELLTLVSKAVQGPYVWPCHKPDKSFRLTFDKGGQPFETVTARGPFCPGIQVGAHAYQIPPGFWSLLAGGLNMTVASVMPRPVPPPSPPPPTPPPQPVLLPPNTNFPSGFQPSLVSFQSATVGLIAGQAGGSDSPALIGVTADGGRTWHETSEIPYPPAFLQDGTDGTAYLAGAACTSTTTVTCTYPIYVSQDGGATWKQVGQAPGPLQAVTPDKRMWALSPEDAGPSPSSSTLVSSDGGATWSAGPAVPCPSDVSLTALDFTGAAGWALCTGQPGAGQEPRAVLSTSDWGAHWTVAAASDDPSSTIGSFGYAFCISFLSDGRGWLSGGRMAPLVTTDAGKTWTSLGAGPSDSSSGTSSLSLVTDDAGFVLVRDASFAELVLFSTTDGGRTWTPVADWAPSS